MTALKLAALPVFELRGVNRSIPGSGPLLRDIDLTLKAGETLAITGPSGSGKSTLLHIVGGLVTPDSGQIQIAGRRPVKQGDWNKIRVHQIGFVFQESWLLPSLTAADNVELPMIGVVGSNKKRLDRVMELLGQLGLVHLARTVASKLSGGERQRVAIARALANCPALILADEPTGNLDTNNTDVVSKILFDVCATQGAALCLATHDLALAKRCARWLALSEGRLEPVSETSAL